MAGTKYIPLQSGFKISTTTVISLNGRRRQGLLVARRSLTGTAALWLSSEKAFKCWESLKLATSKEFPDAIDAKTIHEMMSARKKRSNESCIDYMFAIKDLGKN